MLLASVPYGQLQGAIACTLTADGRSTIGHGAYLNISSNARCHHHMMSSHVTMSSLLCDAEEADKHGLLVGKAKACLPE